MSVFAKTLMISALMLGSSALPRFSARVRSHSRILLLIGTGGLLSLYFGDLLPDVLRLGGTSSVAIIVAVWAVYSLVHVFHLSHHEREHGPDEPAPGLNSTLLLLAAMVAHCFSSGMLLAVSSELSARLATDVFLALIAHKGYEALTFSILLGERVRRRSSFLACIGAYAASFPAGVLAARLGSTAFGLGTDPGTLRMVAMVISSVAVGSLLGCMIHDFLIPSLRHVRQSRHEALWLVLGGALTCLFTMGA